MTMIPLDIRGQTFTADLVDNPTAKALADKLPLTLTMTEHLGNEKYATLKTTLPHQDQAIGHIDVGDILWYQGNAVVIFYDSFDTPYHYTRLGKIRDVEILKTVLGKGDVMVRLQP